MKTNKLISASILRLRMKSPFFAAIALFARFVPAESIPTAATDGKDIFYNPDFLASLPSPQVDGLLLHEVLHAALLHVIRRGTREPNLWNVAADIVVNGAIAEQPDFTLPNGAIRDPDLEKLSVEEIYELLLQNPSKNQTCPLDLLDNVGQLSGIDDARSNSNDSNGDRRQSPPHSGNRNFDSNSRKASLEAYWKAALQKALTIARSSHSQGSIPAGMLRQLGEVTQPQLDWRAYLWRYLVRTPTDFTGFDRRFIGRGLYLDTLDGESVRVFVAVDTSGSVGDEQMRQFLGEVCGILSAYPHIQGDLYYVDAQAYGPHSIESNSDIPPPVGGGGTSFVPFFDAVRQTWDGQSNGVCVYLTDGYGTFPPEPPPLPVLWVVTSGGLRLEKFPFGQTVRLLGNG